MDKLPTNGLGSIACCIAGMPISAVHLYSDLLLDRFSDNAVVIRCTVLVVALYEVSILYSRLVRISSLMSPFFDDQIALEGRLTKMRRRKQL